MFFALIGVRIKPPMLMCLVGTIAMAALLLPGIALGFGGAIAHVADSPSIGWWFFGEVLLGSTLIAQPAYAAAVRVGARSRHRRRIHPLGVGVVASLAAHEAWTPLTVAGGAFVLRARGGFVPMPRFLATAGRSG